MNFTISAEIYVRLANVIKLMPENVTEIERTILKCVRLENKNGHSFAVATNRRIAAIYYLGTTQNPDGVVHLIFDKELIKAAEKEKVYNSIIDVLSIPELKMGTAKTLFGYSFPGNAAIYPDKTPLDKWREWVPDEQPTATIGAMSWTAEYLVMLNAASPSGVVCFPEFIDANKPVVLRDFENANWVGLFMPNRADENGKPYTVDPATLPSWWNV